MILYQTDIIAIILPNHTGIIALSGDKAAALIHNMPKIKSINE